MSDNNFIQCTTPLDHQTAPLKKIAEKVKAALRKEEGNKVKDLGMVSPVHQAITKTDFSAARQGTGSAALNITSHSMSQVAGLTYKTYHGVGHQIGEGTSLSEIYSKPDSQGIRRLISDTLSAIVSLDIDVAKGDTTVIDLNIVKRTWNVSNFLLRSGEVPEKVLTFLPQPVLKDLSDRTVNSSGKISKYGRLVQSKKTNEISTEIKRDWESKFAKALEKEGGSRLDIESKYKDYDPFQDDLMGLIETDPDKRDAEWYYKQTRILDKFLELDRKPASDLSQLVLATRVDTFNAISPTEARLQQRSIDKLIRDDKFGNLDKLISNDQTDKRKTSFLSTLSHNSINTCCRIIKKSNTYCY